MGVPEKAHAVVVSVIRAGRNAPAQVARSKLPGGEVLVSVTEADCPVFKPLFETAV